MLSYKFKHLCSRIIASLSAFGIISVVRDANAGPSYTGGEEITWAGLGSEALFVAEYKQDPCPLSSSDGTEINPQKQIKSFYYSGAEADGTDDRCVYVCRSAPGHDSARVYNHAEYAYVGGASDGFGPHDELDDRLYSLTGNYSAGTYIAPAFSSNLTAFDGQPYSEGYVKTFMGGDLKEEWFSALIETSAANKYTYTGSSVLVLTPDQAMAYTDDICIKRVQTVTFDCEDGKNSAVKPIRWNETLNVPDGDMCVPQPGQVFKHWTLQ